MKALVKALQAIREANMILSAEIAAKTVEEVKPKTGKRIEKSTS